MTPFASAIVGGTIGTGVGLFAAGLFKRVDVAMIMWAGAMAGSAIGAKLGQPDTTDTTGVGRLPPGVVPTLPSRK